MAGKLIIFSAPSGSGKSTIINFLLKQNLNLHFLLPYRYCLFSIPNSRAAFTARLIKPDVFL